MIMHTDNAHAIGRLRLLHILSPALPVGSYSYSQGLEWAVEAGWVNSQQDLSDWIEEQIYGQLAQQDLPLLSRLYQASASNNYQALDYWSHSVVAWRDTAELRQEEKDGASAFLRVLRALPELPEGLPVQAIGRTMLAGLGWIASHWKISQHDLLSAYAHTWMESAIVTGVKIIPLGQSDGQRIQYSLIPALSKAVTTAQCCGNDEIGFSSAAISYASGRHETQYTRIYRS